MITKPEAIIFSNEKIRRMADVIQENYVSAKALLTEWESFKGEFPDDDTIVKDGAEGAVDPVYDGRNIITSTMVHAVIKSCQSFVNLHEQDSKISTDIETVQVNGNKTRFEK